MKDELLKGLDYCYNRPPSKWDPSFVFRFKSNLLPKIIMFISASEDQPQLEDQSEKNAKLAGLI